MLCLGLKDATLSSWTGRLPGPKMATRLQLAAYSSQLKTKAGRDRRKGKETKTGVCELAGAMVELHLGAMSPTSRQHIIALSVEISRRLRPETGRLGDLQTWGLEDCWLESRARPKTTDNDDDDNEPGSGEGEGVEISRHMHISRGWI